MTAQCAYIHCKPDLTVFYVGKGKMVRAHNLNPKSRNKYHRNTVSKYGAENIQIGVIPCSTEAIAFDLEIGLIKCFRRMGVKLTNMTDGGEGKTGCPNSPEAYKLTGDKLRGRKRPEGFGMRVSEWMKNRTLSQETKDRISKSVKALPISPAFESSWARDKTGSRNPHAKAVIGISPEGVEHSFDTLTDAAKYVNGSTTKVCRAIKTKMRHRKWQFKYKESL